MAHFEASAEVNRPAAQVGTLLADMRVLRKNLGPRFTDARPYGPSSGKGARLAALLEQLGLKGAGAFTVTRVAEGDDDATVVVQGEFPPTDFELTFTVTARGASSCHVQLGVEATPQKLAFWRLRSRRAQHLLDQDLPLIFDGLVGRLAAAAEATALDESLAPRVTTDGYVEACEVAQIPVGAGKKVKILKREVALFNVGGAIYACANACAHQGGPLAEGTLEGTVVTCPWHNWTFDVTTGNNTEDPRSTVPTWPTRIEGGKVLVRLAL